jgi:hypothetical protein
MCPVTAATLAISATATSGFAAVAVGAVAGAAAGAAIGVGVSGVVNVATGRGFFEGAGKSALFGAIGGGFSGGVTGAISPLSASAGTLFEVGATLAPYAPSATSIAVTAAAGSLLGSLTPGTPEYSSAIQAARDPQQNSQNITTSGSGGSQARFSLASAIQRSKERKLTQKDVSDLSIDTGSFASTGLQFA